MKRKLIAALFLAGACCIYTACGKKQVEAIEITAEGETEADDDSDDAEVVLVDEDGSEIELEEVDEEEEYVDEDDFDLEEDPNADVDSELLDLFTADATALGLSSPAEVIQSYMGGVEDQFECYELYTDKDLNSEYELTEYYTVEPETYKVLTLEDIGVDLKAVGDAIGKPVTADTAFYVDEFGQLCICIPKKADVPGEYDYYDVPLDVVEFDVGEDVDDVEDIDEEVEEELDE